MVRVTRLDINRLWLNQSIWFTLLGYFQYDFIVSVRYQLCVKTLPGSRKALSATHIGAYMDYWSENSVYNIL